MPIWALADLHLSFGTPDKKMDIFGSQWVNHAEKIAAHWRAKIGEDDLVLLPGDISWAPHLTEALPDLQWIDALPGTKLMLRGNHDYWWSSLKQISQVLPPSIHLIQNNAFSWRDYCIGGTRLWDTGEYSFEKYIHFIANEKTTTPYLFEKQTDFSQRDKIFERELERLELSLRAMPPTHAKRIVMTHYPPIGAHLQDSRASLLLEDYGIQTCVFGHLHSVVHTFDPLFGEKNGIHYYLVAADYIGFDPVLIAK